MICLFVNCSDKYLDSKCVSKIIDDYSILECPECCKWNCLLRQCEDPEICPQPEPKESKGNLNLIYSVGHI